MNTVSKEDYLSIIYKYQDSRGEIKPIAIAQKLQISQAAVTDMLKKLASNKYILYEKYKGVRLTPRGQEFALNMVRRHRIWEVFLQKMLGMPWDKIHEEAHRLEHSSSDNLIDRLEVLLKFPEFDPHGDPIPSKSGKMPKIKKQFALSQLKEGDSGVVKRVNDFDEQFLVYLTGLGINLNEIIHIKEKRGFDNSLLISIKGSLWNISQKLADNIFVELQKVKGQ
jgi:DtxR family transcriptional regulator, Mn-dependent transcriptional regulator